VTITGNTADFDAGGFGDGGGISQAFTAGAFTVKNSIIAGNKDLTAPSGEPVDCSSAGTIASGGSNLIGDKVGCANSNFNSSTKNDQVGDSTAAGAIDPKLAAISPSNGGNPSGGGLTGFHAPLAGSPAIDGVDSGIVPPPATDQRG